MTWQNRNIYTRRFAGNLNKEDPFVEGYSGIKIKFRGKSADAIFRTYQLLFGNDITDDGSSKIDSVASSIGRAYMATYTGMTSMPGGTLGVTDIIAKGGLKWGVVTSGDYGHEFSCRFTEMAGLPIAKLQSAWTNTIRDSNTGHCRLGNVGYTDIKYTKQNWVADFLYYVTKPNGVDIEYAWLFEGVRPVINPINQFAHQVTAVDKLDHDFQYRFDSVWDNQNVYATAKAWAQTIAGTANQFYMKSFSETSA